MRRMRGSIGARILVTAATVNVVQTLDPKAEQLRRYAADSCLAVRCAARGTKTKVARRSCSTNAAALAACLVFLLVRNESEQTRSCLTPALGVKFLVYRQLSSPPMTPMVFRSLGSSTTIDEYSPLLHRPRPVENLHFFSRDAFLND